MKKLADISFFERIENSKTRFISNIDTGDYTRRANEAIKEVNRLEKAFSGLVDSFQELANADTPEEKQQLKSYLLKDFRGYDDELSSLKHGWLGSYIFDNPQCKEIYDRVKKLRVGFINRFNKAFSTENIQKGYWDNTKHIDVDKKYLKADRYLMRSKIPALESVLDIVKANDAFSQWYRKAHDFVDAVSSVGVGNVSENCAKLYSALVKNKMFKDPLKPNVLSQWARHSGWYKRLQTEVPALKAGQQKKMDRDIEAAAKRRRGMPKQPLRSFMPTDETNEMDGHLHDIMREQPASHKKKYTHSKPLSRGLVPISPVQSRFNIPNNDVVAGFVVSPDGTVAPAFLPNRYNMAPRYNPVSW